MPKQLCIEPGCAGTVTYRGRCAHHARQLNASFRRAGHSIYNTKRWRLLRKHVLFRESLCRECGAIATDVDHIVSIAEGGEVWALANLQPLCQHCHGKKTKAEQRVGEGR